jgi:hypothetical protein
MPGCNRSSDSTSPSAGTPDSGGPDATSSQTNSADAGSSVDGGTPSCPPPPMDVVIPMVFPDYLITVDDLSLAKRAAIGATPGVSIVSKTQTATGTRYKIKGLGHAGVAFINGKTGSTQYFEYGRYDPAEKGLVRSMGVPPVTMGSNHKPTKASLKAMLAEISKESGHGTRINAVYIEVTDKYAAMQKYATDREAQNSDANRKPYDLTSNNCFTFSTQVAGAAGVDVSMANKMFPSSSMTEMQKTYPALTFDPSTNDMSVGVPLN